MLDVGLGRGLIGPREADRVWMRHILNSVAPADLVPAAVGLVDVGSGAGLPGLPLAVLRPDLSVTLLEPLLRRAIFLDEVVASLGLSDRVRVVRARAEDHHQRYDVVTARAVAPLPRLLPWVLPLRRSDGRILALKGRSAADELAATAADLDRLRLRADLLSVRADPRAESTSVIRISSR